MQLDICKQYSSCFSGCLDTRLDSVSDRVVALTGELGHKVEVDELVLLGVPLAIRVAVVDEFSGSGVAHLGGSVRKFAFGLPLDVVACALGHEEGLSAPLVPVAVETLLDCKVEDRAGCDL